MYRKSFSAALWMSLLLSAAGMETTRVATLMYAKDLSPASYPASGNRGGFHGASHHANVKANMDSFALINKYHVQMLTYFVDKLAKIPDGVRSLDASLRQQHEQREST